MEIRRDFYLDKLIKRKNNVPTSKSQTFHKSCRQYGEAGKSVQWTP